MVDVHPQIAVAHETHWIARYFAKGTGLTPEVLAEMPLKRAGQRVSTPPREGGSSASQQREFVGAAQSDTRQPSSPKASTLRAFPE
jgi:hypothetical protein